MLALQILLIFTILLQLIAAVISWRMFSITKYNAAWILFSVAFGVTVFQLFAEFVNTKEQQMILPKDLMAWMGVLSALCFTVGLFLVKRLISYITQLDRQHRLTEQRILNMVISTEEKERRRFSKDLHDDLGPILSSAKMSVTALMALETKEQHRQILQNTDYAISEAIKSLKEVSNNLSPHILENFGVSRALSSFINKLVLLPTVKINYISKINNDRFYREVEAVIYRVVCELINNALKHSKASIIDITIEYVEDNLLLCISDNGCGFDYKKIEESGSGMGLSNITSRINSIGGEIKVDTIVGAGTKIDIKLRNCLNLLLIN